MLPDMAKLAVIGSSNTDMVVKTARFPRPGETLLGGDFYMFPGGKGANQAVAAARLGATVTFLCCVGDDIFGRDALEHYKKEGMVLEGVHIEKGVPSGVALITINEAGENEIVVASGANACLSDAHLQKNRALLEKADVLLTQLETPMECLAFLAEHSRQSGQRLILNPAPARTLPAEVLEGLYLLTPNQSETLLLTGIEVTDETGAEAACSEFFRMGIRNVIITMGSLGAYFGSRTEAFMVPAPRVMAQDTTAAGDVFNGALAVGLSEGASWQDAMSFANKAAALSVTRMGAQASAPHKHEFL